MLAHRISYQNKCCYKENYETNDVKDEEVIIQNTQKDKKLKIMFGSIKFVPIVFCILFSVEKQCVVYK